MSKAGTEHEFLWQKIHFSQDFVLNPETCNAHGGMVVVETQNLKKKR